MTSLKTQKKAFSFSIDSIINSDKDKVSEEYKKEKQPLAHAIVSGHLSPVSFVENAPLSILPEESDFRGDEELSECSDTSGQMSTTHNSTCSTPESDQSGLSNKSPSSDSSLGSLSTPVMTRKKKARTAFTQKQIDDLEKRYASQRYLTATERGDLAEELELTDQQVKTWFQNRRMKEKRQRHDKLDGPAFPTGGVDVSQLHALGIPCPLPPGGAPQYTSAMNAHHSRPLPNLLPHSMPMFPQHIPGYPPMPRQAYGGLPVYHSYGLPFPHQMSLPVPAFGPVQ